MKIDKIKSTSNRESQNTILQDYLKGIGQCIEEISQQDIVAVADVIYHAYLKGRHIFIFGNGGSASTASHFARDLRIGTAVSGKPRVKSLSLTDNVVLITSLANDIDYESIFVEPLIGQVEPGDVVIGISCSGNSPNVLKAITYARECGAVTIGLAAFGGGRLSEMTDKYIVLTTRDYGQAEDIHLCLGHILTYMVRKRIRDGR